MRKYCWILFIVLLFALTSCAEKEEADAAEKKPQEKEEVVTTEDLTEDEEEIQGLTVDEVKQIVIENIKEREKIMQQHREEHNEWLLQNWSIDRDDEGEEFQSAVSVVRESLSGIMTDNVLDELAELYTRVYFCECDWYIGGAEDVEVRVEIIEQSEDHFQAKSITLVEDGMLEQGGWTNVWNFIREGNTWKMDQEQTISPGEEPLDLTFGDLQDALLNYETGEPQEIELIEEDHEYEGNTYLVILHESGVYSVWDVADGSVNYDLSQEYNESDETVNVDDNFNDNTEDNNHEAGYLAFSDEELEAMVPWGGDWERIDNHGEGQGFISARPPAIDIVIIDNQSILSGSLEVPSENNAIAIFYGEDSSCKLDLTLIDEKTMEVKEITECKGLVSTPEGTYELNPEF